MNLYIWLNSTDESDTEEYMKFSEKCCIGCMEDYTYGNELFTTFHRPGFRPEGKTQRIRGK